MREKVRTIHIILFIVTFYCVTVMGVFFHPDYGDYDLSLILTSPRVLSEGLPFSISLLFIIGIHEIGHLIGARKNGIVATMPYFLPAPPFITLGTFGAFIKVKSPIGDRRSLIDMASYGPIFGFVGCIVTLFYGIFLHFRGYYNPFDFGVNVRLPLIMALAQYPLIGGFKSQTIFFENPFLASAFIGFFIQGLNLLFVGQLDGGHILYALFPKAHKTIGTIITIFLLLLSPFGLQFFVWAVIFFLLGIKHPPTLKDNIPLTKREILLGFSCLLIFVLSFHPLPFVD